MSVRPVVLKFGGTSVEDAFAFVRVADIVRSAGSGAVVVTSAMSRVTDALLRAVELASAGDVAAATAEVQATLARHTAVVAALLTGDARDVMAGELRGAADKLSALLRIVAEHPGTRRPLQDEIVSFGERLSSLLLAHVLRAQGLSAQWVDARSCIRTDEDYARAAPLMEATSAATVAALTPVLARDCVPVLGGFIGSAPGGATTTLGRGGSDYSAALVAGALGARELQIWTDVSGFLTADPRVVPEAKNIERLQYAEAAELAFFGAKVLHPRTIQPAVEQRIPVRICNSRAPGSGETLIDERGSSAGIKAIAHKRGITVMQLASARMLGAYGFLRATFEVFDRHRTAVDIVATSEVSVSLTVEDSSQLEAIVPDLEALGTVTVERDHAIVCVVGEGLRQTSGIATRVFRTLADINVVLISQGASSINLTFVVREDYVADVVRRLHAEFFG